MTYEQLDTGGKIICFALALSPFWMGWLGEQFGRWLRRKYEQWQDYNLNSQIKYYHSKRRK